MLVSLRVSSAGAPNVSHRLVRGPDRKRSPVGLPISRIMVSFCPDTPPTFGVKARGVGTFRISHHVWRGATFSDEASISATVDGTGQLNLMWFPPISHNYPLAYLIYTSLTSPTPQFPTRNLSFPCVCSPQATTARAHNAWETDSNMVAHAPATPKIHFGISKNSEQEFSVNISTFYVCT